MKDNVVASKTRFVEESFADVMFQALLVFFFKRYMSFSWGHALIAVLPLTHPERPLMVPHLSRALLGDGLDATGGTQGTETRRIDWA